MKFFLLALLSICSAPAFAQDKYTDFVDFFKKRLTNSRLLIKHFDKGIKSIAYYSCSDTIFLADKCSKDRVTHFYSRPDLILDTLFMPDGSITRQIEIANGFIKTTEISFANGGGKETKTTTDSLVLNKSKLPIELYENNVLKTKWTYDSNDRIIGKTDNIGQPDQLTTTTLTYNSNSIVESIETKDYDGVWNHKYEILFDDKSKNILRENIYNEKVRFFSEGKTVKTDSIVYHEPLALTRHTIYQYEPQGVKITYFDSNSLLTEKRKLDKKNRIVFQCSLNEKGDTLSYYETTYFKNRVVSSHFQDNVFFERTTKHLDDKGRVRRELQVSADPQIWKKKDYDENGIVTQEIDINYTYKSMKIAGVEK
jgi:hypothetical protein